MKTIALIFLLLLFAPFVSFAEWMPAEKADYEMIRDEVVMDVAADGTSTVVEDVSYRALNEKGRSKLVLETVPYLPDTMEIKVTDAWSTTDGVDTKADLSKIQSRKAQGPAEGMNNAMELVIPFSNMKIGSTIRYKMTSQVKKVAFPGLFTMRFFTGLKFPEKGGKAVIKSVKPLTWSAETDDGVLTVKESREGALYVLSVTQNRPAFRVPLDFSPVYGFSDVARVDVSTGESWAKFASDVSAKYEKILANKELPAPFKAIAGKAAGIKDLNKKIDTVVSELAAAMTYSGDWTSQEKLFYPETLEALAGKKTGDCKDFAMVTTAILRKLGIAADVAFVRRTNSQNAITADIEKPRSEKIVLPDIFNHAIVHISKGQEDMWVDPTNMVADSSFVFYDVAGSRALVINPSTQGIKYLPKQVAGTTLLQTEKTVKINPDDTIDTNGTISLTGEYSKAVVETALTKTEKDGQELLAALYGGDVRNSRYFVDGVDLKNRMSSKMTAQIRTLSEKMVTQNKDKKKVLILPLSSRINYYLKASGERVTSFNVGPTASEKTKIKVEGYDFGEETVGCVARTPWYTLERKFLKVEGGFEVTDQFEIKKSLIDRGEVISEHYRYELGHIEECAVDQLVEIVKLDGKSTLRQRTAGYSLEKAKKLNDARGAESVGKIKEAKQMLEQLLAADPQSKALRLQYHRSLAMVGYIRSDIDRYDYYGEAGKVIDRLYEEYPKDPEVLQMKARFAGRCGDLQGMTKFFQLSYYASPKNYDLYVLGGYVADKMSKPKVAEGSYLKALALTADPEQQGDLYDHLAHMATQNKDYDKAAGLYDKAIEKLPKDAWLFSHYVELLNWLKRWDKGIEVGEKMLQISDFGVGRRLLAEAYSGKARERFEQRLQKGGSMSDAERNEISATCMKAIQYKQSESECLRILGLFALRTARGEHKIDQAQKAYDYFERALKDEDINIKSEIERLKDSAEKLIGSLKNPNPGRQPGSAQAGGL